MVTSSQTLLSRRRFLAIVGASAGVVFLGRHAYAAPGDGVRQRDVSGDENTPDGYTPIAVAEGLIDATVWNGSLMTLRNGASGYFVRDEHRDTDYSIDAPDEVQIFCIAHRGGMLVAGGHLIRKFEPMTLKSGQPYEDLLANAGDEAEHLKRQPGAPSQPAGFTFHPTSHRPVLMVTQDGYDWKLVEFSLDPLLGGTVGAILEDEDIVAVLRYVDSAITDSGITVDLLSLQQALQGSTVKHGKSLPVPHGGIWGTYQGPSGGVIVTTGHNGTQGRLATGSTAFVLPEQEQLLGITYTKDGYRVATQLPTGRRVLKTFGSPLDSTTQMLTADELVLHGVAPEVIIGTAAGFAKAEPYKTIRRTRLQ